MFKRLHKISDVDRNPILWQILIHKAMINPSAEGPVGSAAVFVELSVTSFSVHAPGVRKS